MKDDAIFLDELDLYLKGELSPEAKTNFEKSVEIDSEKKAILIQQTALVNATKQYHRQEMKNHFQNLEMEMKDQTSQNNDSRAKLRPLFVQYRWVVAATVVLFVLSVVLLKTGNEPNSETLFLEYAEHYQSGLGERGNESISSACEAFQLAISHYNAQKYTEAIQVFETTPWKSEEFLLRYPSK